MNMNTDKRVSEIMNSLEGIERAKAPKKVFPEILQEIENTKFVKHNTTKRWLAVAAVISLVICSNVLVITDYFNTPRPDNSDLQLLVTDFNIYGNE